MPQDLTPSQELRYEHFEEWAIYLARFPWHWHATLTFQYGVNFYQALRLFKRWRLRLIDEERLQIAGYLLSSYKQRYLHFHVLLLSKNRHGKTLLDCSRKDWESRWPYNARIKVVRARENERVCRYVALHLLGFKSAHCELDSFNRSLLRQNMRLQRDGLDGYDGLPY